MAEPSASVAVYVPTVAVPSATLADAVAPSSKTGFASLTSVMDMVTVPTSAVPVTSADMIVRV